MPNQFELYGAPERISEATRRIAEVCYDALQRYEDSEPAYDYVFPTLEFYDEQGATEGPSCDAVRAHLDKLHCHPFERLDQRSLRWLHHRS